jgi:MSHA biogenesis protein MshL
MPLASSGTLGLALATKGFQAVLGFLETHGDLQVLSSPRMATLNNQKAVLKVGTDEFFVTGCPAAR